MTYPLVLLVVAVYILAAKQEGWEYLESLMMPLGRDRPLPDGYFILA